MIRKIDHPHRICTLYNTNSYLFQWTVHSFLLFKNSLLSELFTDYQQNTATKKETRAKEQNEKILNEFFFYFCPILLAIFTVSSCKKSQMAKYTVKKSI